MEIIMMFMLAEVTITQEIMRIVTIFKEMI